MAKHYTVQQANEVLPQLTELLLRMQAVGRQQGMVQERIGEVTQAVRSNGHHNPIEDPMVTQAAVALDDSLREGLRQLAEWHIELKDLSSGLVDFPTLREGREVYLCWWLGEDEVAFWHELTTGFAGRQPVDEKLL
jgi:hypothetical protein